LEFTAGSTGTNINRQFAVTSASSVIGVAGTGTLGTVPISAALTGAGSLTKIDTGTLILNSSSTNYAGSTTVLGGALIISNPGIGNLGTLSAMAGAGPVTVGDGSTRAGTFGGNGIIPGDIVVNGNGTLLPGAYTSVTTSYLPATLTGDGSLTIHSGATIFEKVANAGSFDSINLVNAGSLNFDSGTNTVKLALLAVTGTSGPSQTDKYDFITLPAGEIVNNFTPTTYTNGVETTSGTFYIDTSGAAGAFGAPNGYVGIDQPTLTASGDIYFTDVPEPGMSAVIIGLGLPLMRRRRRSSRAESSKASSLITSST
jgi:autotransporter-associated beta strand protein